MTAWVRIGLMVLALLAFAGGGAALGVVRIHKLHQGRTDWSMVSICGALISVGALCTAAAAGFVGILAFGGVSVWASYILTAQRMGLFRVQSTTFEERRVEEPRPRA